MAPIKVNIPPPVNPKLKVDSMMLDAEKHYNFIKNECFGGREFDMNRLFRGTENGFTPAAYHQLVDNKTDILYLISTVEHKRTFGGYYSIN